MTIELVTSPALQLERILPWDVTIWTPPQYAQNPDARFPAIYRYDGQNLFDPHKSNIEETPEIELDMEYINPIEDGGKIRLDNLITICSECKKTH